MTSYHIFLDEIFSISVIMYVNKSSKPRNVPVIITACKRKQNKKYFDFDFFNQL